MTAFETFLADVTATPVQTPVVLAYTDGGTTKAKEWASPAAMVEHLLRHVMPVTQSVDVNIAHHAAMVGHLRDVCDEVLGLLGEAQRGLEAE